MNDLRELKQRLMKQATRQTSFRCVVMHHGAVVSEHQFDDDVVKIGKLRSSHLCLEMDDIARMHAVLERSGGVWRVIDLGSSSGTFLNGDRVDKNAVLPPEGTLSFGSLDVRYVIGATSLADVVDDVAKAEREMSGRDHHKAMMESLMAEMERVAPRSHQSASFFRKGWHLFDDERKRKSLRMMVQTIRDTRTEAAAFDRRRAAAMLVLGPEGIEQLYDLEAAEALAKARQTLQEMADAKQCIEMLRELDLVAGVSEAVAVATSTGQRVAEGVEQFQRGHAALLDNLETSLAAGSTVLLACLSRAGGATLSEEEREQLRTQWDATVNAARST